jgi:WD40 repeat protein
MWRSRKEVGKPMQHEDVVTSVQFSPDGQLVLTASGADGTARLGDATSCKEIGELLKHGDVVHSAQFSPDGLGVVTASADCTARLWNIPAIGDKDTAEDVLLLAGLAEASGGLSVQSSEEPELLHALTSEEVQAKRKEIADKFCGTIFKVECLRNEEQDHLSLLRSHRRPMDREQDQ